MAHEELLTREQVAEWLHVSIRFVTEHSAELGGVRLGGSAKKAGRLRYRESKVQGWIEGGGSSPVPDQSARRPNETASRAEPKRMDRRA